MATGIIEQTLRSVNLSDEHYAKSFASFRFWFDIGHTYHQVPSDQIFNAIWNGRRATSIDSESGKLIHSTAHLILRFASDAESDHTLALHSSALQRRLCTRSLREFFTDNLMTVVSRTSDVMPDFYTDANLIACWANLGYVEENAIRNHILQSLISHYKLYDHQANALIIQFKLAGATFEAYADPSVVNRCFELLRDHKYHNPWRSNPQDPNKVHGANIYERIKKELIQEVITLRERGWEGLPPPPLFKAEKSRPTGTNQKDPTATSVVIPLGLPSKVLEPQSPQPPPPELPTAREPDPIHAPSIIPVTQSPSASISTLSELTIADASDDESLINPTIGDVSDHGPSIDPTTTVPHETFYLNDGNVEVLCGNTLFRAHATILSFHSPALRSMFGQASLTAAESPNGFPRILSSDTPKDFSALLKIIYLPGFPEWSEAPDFATFSSLLRITAKYEMPTVRSRVLKVVRDAYPETFQGLAPSKLLGESVFSSPTPHPNEVLNLFVQQNLAFALPMAYYMAIRRGPNSLVGGHLPRSATLSPEILQSAFRGLMGLREVELNETHRLVFGPKGPHPCSTSNCPSRTPTGPAALEAYQKVLDRIVGSSQLGTKVLQVPELYEDFEGVLRCVGPGICSGCVERWESGHAELRKKAWGMLPDVFGLNG